MALIKCTECGKEFSDRASACPNCGCPIRDVRQVGQVYTNSNYEDADSNSNVAIASMVLGIISLFTWMSLLGFILALIGLGFGVSVLYRNLAGRPMAITGVVTSSISVLVFLVLLAFI